MRSCRHEMYISLSGGDSFLALEELTVERSGSRRS